MSEDTVEHVVFYPAPDGSPAFRRVASLEEAVSLVEHLSNVEGVRDVTVHQLHQVELAFKTYVKVELPTAVAAAESMPAPTDLVEAEAPAGDAVAAAPVAEEHGEVVEPAAAEHGAASDEPEREPALVAPAGDANGHRDVGGLGFFA